MKCAELQINCKINFLQITSSAFSALTFSVWRQEGHPVDNIILLQQSPKVSQDFCGIGPTLEVLWKVGQYNKTRSSDGWMVMVVVVVL